MAKKVARMVKLQCEAGKATPAPPIGPALGQAGVNIMAFVKEFNERTAKQAGYIIPVEITVYEDRSFTFITKTPPAAVLCCGAPHVLGLPVLCAAQLHICVFRSSGARGLIACAAARRVNRPDKFSALFQAVRTCPIRLSASIPLRCRRNRRRKES